MKQKYAENLTFFVHWLKKLKELKHLSHDLTIKYDSKFLEINFEKMTISLKLVLNDMYFKNLELRF